MTLVDPIKPKNIQQTVINVFSGLSLQPAPTMSRNPNAMILSMLYPAKTCTGKIPP